MLFVEDGNCGLDIQLSTFNMGIDTPPRFDILSAVHSELGDSPRAGARREATPLRNHLPGGFMNWKTFHSKTRRLQRH